MPNQEDLAVVAEMVYTDLIASFGTNKPKVPLDRVLAEAKAATSTLGAEFTAAQLISAMEQLGYLARNGREYVLSPPNST